MKHIRRLTSIFLLTLSLSVTPAQVIRSEPVQENATHLAYRNLASIIDRQDDTSFKGAPNVKEVVAQLEVLISKVVGTALSRPSARDTDLAAELSTLYGLHSFDVSMTNTPTAELFTVGSRRTAAISYVIPESGHAWAWPNTYPRLEFFQSIAGSWTKVSQVDLHGDFPRSEFFSAKLRVPDPNYAYFVVYGSEGTSNVNAIIVSVYRFDGISVDRVFHRENLRHGGVKVTDDSLTLDYYVRRQNSKDKQEDHFIENFKLVAGELKCQSQVCGSDAISQ